MYPGIRLVPSFSRMAGDRLCWLLPSSRESGRGKREIMQQISYLIVRRRCIVRFLAVGLPRIEGLKLIVQRQDHAALQYRILFVFCSNHDLI